eukprot:gene6044-7529_t
MTTDVGPRILSLSYRNESNIFYINEAQAGQTGGTDWKIYGGHRVWHAPENVPRTYFGDNFPINITISKDKVVLTQPTESTTGIQKIITIEGKGHGELANLQVTHTLANKGLWAVEIAPWAISTMGEGTTAILPMSNIQDPNAPRYGPRSLISVWKYSNLENDTRIHIGTKYVLVHQIPGISNSNKIGTRSNDGFTAALNKNQLFIKTISKETKKIKTDFGSNIESYVADYLELETFGEYDLLEPNSEVKKSDNRSSYSKTVDYCFENIKLQVNGPLSRTTTSLTTSLLRAEGFGLIPINDTITLVDINYLTPIGSGIYSINIDDQTNPPATFSFTYQCEMIPEQLEIKFERNVSPSPIAPPQSPPWTNIYPFTIENIDSRKIIPENSFSISCTEGFRCILIPPSFYESTNYFRIKVNPKFPFPRDLNGFLDVVLTDMIHKVNYNTRYLIFNPPEQKPTRILNSLMWPAQTVNFNRKLETTQSHWIFTTNSLNSFIYSLDPPNLNPLYYQPLSGSPTTNQTYVLNLGTFNYLQNSDYQSTLDEYYNNSTNTLNSDMLVINSKLFPTIPLSNSILFDPDIKNYDNFTTYVGIEYLKNSVNGLLFPAKGVLTRFTINKSEKIDFQFPFGYTNGNVTHYNYRFGTLQSNYIERSNLLINMDSTDIGEFNFIYKNSLVDINAPVLQEIKYVKWNDTHFITQLHVTDDIAGIYEISLLGYTLDYRDLVGGTLLDAHFEKLMTIQLQPSTSLINLVTLTDKAYNIQTYRDVFNSNLDTLPLNPFTSQLLRSPISLQNITFIQFNGMEYNAKNEKLGYNLTSMFLKNDVNCSLLLNLTISNPIGWLPKLIIRYPGGADPQIFTGTWDQQLRMYTIKFNLKPRVYPGLVEYDLDIQSMLISSQELIFKKGESAELKVFSIETDIADQMPPLIVDVIVVNGPLVSPPTTGEIVTFGWELNIVDEQNGFDRGEIIVYSDMDRVPYVFNINLENRKSGGTDRFGTYSININASVPCISQSFSIHEITLIDKLGYTSKTSNTIATQFKDQPPKGANPGDPVFIDPLIRYPTPNILPSLSLNCPALNPIDQTVPDRISFTNIKVLPLSVDLGLPYPENRTIGVNFTVTSLLPLSYRHLPIVYFNYANTKYLSCPTFLISKSDDRTINQYGCTIVLPHGLTFNKEIPISIFGATDVSLHYSGISKPSITLSSTYTNTIPFLESASSISADGGTLTVFGKNFIGYSTSTKLSSAINFEINYGNGYESLIPNLIHGTVFTSEIQSHKINRVIKIRVSNGKDISNEIIIVPTPSQTPKPTPTASNPSTPSPTEPQTPTPTLSQSPEPKPVCKGNCGGSDKGYCDERKGCICFKPWSGESCQSKTINTTEPTIANTETHSSNEVIVNGKPVQFSTFISIVAIQELNHLLSPIKTHKIESWNLTSFTNSSSRVDDQYDFKTMKLKINDIHFYGKFIDIGYIDNKIISIQNRQVDEFGVEIFSNETTQENSNQSETQIGMIIPQYSNSVILDPDFSHLLDYSNDAEEQCNGGKKNGGLSKTKIAGIIEKRKRKRI